jgi:hypothetical protein
MQMRGWSVECRPPVAITPTKDDKMRFPRVYVLIGVVLVTGVVSGCDRSRPSYATTRLEGAVTIAGNPVSEGRVQFMHEGANAQPAQADIVAGRYVCEQAPRGKVRVSFYIVRETGKTTQAYNRKIRSMVDLVPEKYRNGMDLNISGGSATQDFHL